MHVFEFDINRPVQYVITGKFEAPSPMWMHENFPLIDYELFVITKDVLYISYNDESFAVKEGEYLLLPPMPPPGNRRKGYQSSNCSFYWLHFNIQHDVRVSSISGTQHSFYQDYARHNSDHIKEYTLSIPQQAQIPRSQKVVVLMKQLQDSIRNNYSNTAVDYLSTVILCELHSQLYHTYGVSADDKSKKEKKQLYNDIIDYIKQNTDRNLKVSDVAFHFGYNAKYLSHLFSNIAGIPLKQFILNVKMDAANFMLIDTNCSINEIAHSLGFTDSHNFAKAYKKVAGMTPTEYRNAFSKRLLYHV